MVPSKAAIRNMGRINCCCVVFALCAKTTQQQVFSFFSKGFSKFQIPASKVKICAYSAG